MYLPASGAPLPTLHGRDAHPTARSWRPWTHLQLLPTPFQSGSNASQLRLGALLGRARKDHRYGDGRSRPHDRDMDLGSLSREGDHQLRKSVGLSTEGVGICIQVFSPFLIRRVRAHRQVLLLRGENRRGRHVS